MSFMEDRRDGGTNVFRQNSMSSTLPHSQTGWWLDDWLVQTYRRTAYRPPCRTFRWSYWNLISG